MNRSKAAIAVSKIASIIQMLAGVFIVFTFGLCTIMYFTDAEFQSNGISFLVTCLIIDAIGIALILFSRKRSKLIKEFKNFVGYISEDPSGSIANLASAMGTSQDVVKNNLELMIKRKYFVNARIDLGKNCIVIGSGAKSTQQKVQQSNTTGAAAAAVNMPKIQYVTVTCKCCGGINKIVKGNVAECDFCGSPING